MELFSKKNMSMIIMQINAKLAVYFVEARGKMMH